MEKYVGRIWMAVLAVALAIVVLVQGDSLTPIEIPEGATPFRTALVQLGVLYVIALFVERSLEVLIKAWRQAEKTRLEEKVRSSEDDSELAAEKNLQEYKAGTQRRTLLLGLTLGILVSLAGVRLLGPIFEFADAGTTFQRAVFQFTDIALTAGLIAGGSATIHELMALIDDFLKTSRKRARNSPIRRSNASAR
ncbi:MAG: hypothetical protein OXQ94_18400 [Gemmatimonadota bacterium]|nr:hypothetical protein [Gemmatimonadota bacterium]MDE2873646.1 hypothetical protein [Gemmatimonadota bacterium]